MIDEICGNYRSINTWRQCDKSVRWLGWIGVNKEKESQVKQPLLSSSQMLSNSFSLTTSSRWLHTIFEQSQCCYITVVLDQKVIHTLFNRQNITSLRQKNLDNMGFQVRKDRDEFQHAKKFYIHKNYLSAWNTISNFIICKRCFLCSLKDLQRYRVCFYISRINLLSFN